MSRRTARARILGFALVATGLAWLAQTAGLAHLAPNAIMSVFLVALGAGLIAGARWGPFWNLVLLGVLIAVVLTSAKATRLEISGKVGDITETPLTIADLRPYTLGVGDLELDLTQFQATGEPTVDASVGVGDLLINVPANIPVQVEGHVGLGEVVIFGVDRSHSGFPIELRYTDPNFNDSSTRILLKLNVAIGRIEVRRGSS